MCDLLQVLRVSGPRSIAFLFTSRGISILVHFPVQHSIPLVFENFESEVLDHCIRSGYIRATFVLTYQLRDDSAIMAGR